MSTAANPKATISAGTLFVVATPIGNLGDLSPRAREVLATVKLVAAEDTRHTRQLLQSFGIATPLTSLHEHNEAQKSGDSETEQALRPRLNELAETEKSLYPPPSPYFRDSRTALTATGKRQR